MEKFPILDKNHRLTPLEKSHFLTVSTTCFYSLKRHFSLENIIKHIFLALIAQKKEDKKMANFGPKPSTNPFGKNSIFRLSQHLVFILQKSVLSLQNTIKHIFLAYIVFKKEDGKKVLDQNHRLTLLEKYKFFVFFTCFFLQPREAFRRYRIS